jgi:Flp pilus assembly protein TadD
MIYLFVVITSLMGIALLLLTRGLLRSRNVRRIVHSIRRGMLRVQERNAQLLPDPPLPRTRKPPRAAAVELQQVRSLLHTCDKAMVKQDIHTAERVLIQALTIHPEAKEVKAKLARLYLDSCREQKAEALYRELVLSCREPSIYANLGLCCYKQEKYVEACEAYQEALNLDSKDPERSYDLGRACFAAQRFADATPLLEKAVERMTKDTQLLHLLAQCYLQLNEGEKAEEIYRRINRLEPRDEGVKEKITELALR